jgi:hypothetical protein
MKAIYITKTTFRCPLFFGTLLGLQQFIKAVVGNLQNKASVHHTVPRLQSAMGEVFVVQVLHTLETSNTSCVPGRQGPIVYSLRDRGAFTLAPLSPSPPTSSLNVAGPILSSSET